MIARNGILLRSLKRGRQGELMVASILERLPTDSYQVFNDVLMRVGGKTFQLDHLVLSIYGIFVIETKAYGGKVYGTDQDYKWKCRRGGRAFMFYSPIRQVSQHVGRLRRIVGSEVPIYPMVCFTGPSVLKVRTFTVPVFSVKSLMKHISRVQDEVLTADALLQLREKVTRRMLTGHRHRKSHENYVRDLLNVINKTPLDEM